MDEFAKITSRDNARLVRFRKVRDGKIRSEVFIEGIRLAEELLRSNPSVLEGVFTPEIMQDPRGRALIDQLLQRAVPLFEVPQAVFRSVADTVHPQGILLIAKRPEIGKQVIERSLSSDDPGLLVFLYQIADPSNTGAIFRTAEAAGVTGLIMSEGSANAFSPKAMRAAMGSNLRVPVWENASPLDAVEVARKWEMRIAAADIRGKKSYTDLDWVRPTMIMFGSEADGLPPEMLSRIDSVFVIPMRNEVESLNLAVSCGVVLFEALRQKSLRAGNG